jgi:hypothetical protein
VRFWLKTMGMVTAACTLLCLSAPGAGAAQPVKQYFQVTDVGTDISLCGFPIQFSSEGTGFAVFFSDPAGALVQIQAHVTGQDTFSANGVTLVGSPYRTLAKLVFSDGQLVEYHASGVLEKVRLPDGRTFLGAGRVDLTAAAHASFIVDPDSGVVKDKDAFCAALSG